MRSFICKDCNHIELIGRYDTHGQAIGCPDCRGIMTQLDDEIAPIITSLNRKGYLTTVSCGSHIGLIPGNVKGSCNIEFENTAYIGFVPVKYGYHFNVDHTKVNDEGDPIITFHQTLHQFFDSINDEKKLAINLWNCDSDVMVRVRNDMYNLVHRQDEHRTATQAFIFISAFDGKVGRNADPYTMKNALNTVMKLILTYVNDHMSMCGEGTDYALWGKDPSLCISRQHPNFVDSAGSNGINIV